MTAPRPFIRTLLPHLVWEVILFFIAAAAVLITFIEHEPPLFLWLNLATLGILASAFSLSLRTSAPNLAVPAIATLAGAIYAVLSKEDWPVPVAVGVAVLAACLLGAIMGLMTGLTSLPAWAVSFGGLVLAQAVIFSLIDARGVIVRDFDRPDSGTATVFMMLFVFGSIAGGAIFAIPAVRRLVDSGPAPAEPVPFQPKRLLVTLLGFTASSLIAAVAGLMTTSAQGIVFAASSNSALPTVMGAALLGGASIFGRRGGIAGTVLAVAAISFIPYAFDIARSSAWLSFGLPAVAIFVGLGIGWAMEKIAGPREAS